MRLVIYECPLFVREHSKKLLRAAIWNDSLFLSKLDVMDYSLIAGFEEGTNNLIIGIVGNPEPYNALPFTHCRFCEDLYLG